ncbi:MAG: CvpA family protein [Steroidobacteraceae bacterium]|jgi:membrane protein required for colicin V production|nr:CvpA family protein [Steroidobacteraceae bacterium]
MNGADYLFVAILLFSVTAGAIRGFLREAILLLAWLAGLWVAWHYAHILGPYLGGALDSPVLREWAGRIILLVAIVFSGSILASFVAWLLQRSSGLAATDRLMGALFGLVRALVIIGVFVLAGRGLDMQGEDWWSSSKFMVYAEHAANWIERYAEPAVKPLLGSWVGSLRG